MFTFGCAFGDRGAEVEVGQTDCVIGGDGCVGVGGEVDRTVVSTIR